MESLRDKIGRALWDGWQEHLNDPETILCGINHGANESAEKAIRRLDTRMIQALTRLENKRTGLLNEKT